jgi:DNA-binding transcriptional LysR family regulator
MSNLDHFDLDGHLLALLVAVVEERSVTRAALRLGVSQSAVSHLLDKLRGIVGDPLLVRSGRGVVPTVRAELLAQRARPLLDELRSFVSAGGFDPARLQGPVVIAANDLQRDLLLPALLDRLRAAAPHASLQVMPSGVPGAELLRDGQCQLLITPRPPDAADLVQKRLFVDRHVVFFDPAVRGPPASLADWLAAEHVTVVYHPHRLLDIDDALARQGVARRFVATVPGYAGVPALLRGSARIATAPSLLGRGQFSGLASAEPPLPCPLLPMYLVWHRRHQDDPLHAWLRQLVQDSVPDALASAPA